MNGDLDAINEAIARQQKGRALRYYPEGRSGPDDDGAILVSVQPRFGTVQIKSGRPSRAIMVGKENAFEWIRGIPKCLTAVARQYTAIGMTPEQAFVAMEDSSTRNFSVDVETAKELDSIRVRFNPSREDVQCWELGGAQCAVFVRKVYEACNDMGWDYREESTEDEIRLADTLIDEAEQFL